MRKKLLDAIIALTAGIIAYFAYRDMPSGNYRQLAIILLLGIAAIAMLDMIFSFRKRRLEEEYDGAEFHGISELILLNENDKPIKSWELSGKTSLLIGKNNKIENVDVDLEECEYSSLIDAQHAVLNYCLDHWYVEDMYSQNGVRVQMIKDGLCYKVSKNRACRLMAGDVILIANTKLLIT